MSSDSEESASTGLELHGKGIAPGVAVGPVFFLDNELPVAPRWSLLEGQVDIEVDRLNRALRQAEEEFRLQAEEFGKTFSGNEKRIFDTHVHFYQDEVFRQNLEDRVRGGRLNAEAAVYDEVEHLGQVLAGMDSLFRERQADIRDVGNRIRRVLLREQQAELAEGDEPFVLCARELLPSDTMNIDRQRLLGIVTELGGDASHVAILARAFDVPAVSGIPDLQERAVPGAHIAVDGTGGRVFVEPTEEQRGALDAARDAHERRRREWATKASARARFEEQSGLRVLLNIENFAFLDEALLQSTDGIGLYRTEFLFMGRSTFPSEDEQAEFYESVLEKARGQEVVFRTIDVGGDKPLRYLSTPREVNPALGWRGLRLTSQWPDLLIPQLRALIRASARGPLRVMLPMVTTIEEFREVRSLYADLIADLRREGMSLDNAPPLGVMIEVPACAFAAADFAREADFLSVGTNDLAQYYFAVDRNNLRVARLYQPLHPSFLRLLAGVFAAADAAGKTVSVCGEMAGLELSVLALLGLGLRRFSMSPSHVPEARRIFEAFEPEEAARVVRPLLERATESAVLDGLRAAFEERLGPSGSAAG